MRTVRAYSDTRWGRIIAIILTAAWKHHAVDDACSRDHTRAPSRPAPPRGLRLVKMASIMEGPLSKWTNVMKGWQYRWFVLDYNAGLLSYYTVSRFPPFLYWGHAAAWLGAESCQCLSKPQVRWLRALLFVRSWESQPADLGVSGKTDSCAGQ